MTFAPNIDDILKAYDPVELETMSDRLLACRYFEDAEIDPLDEYPRAQSIWLEVERRGLDIERLLPLTGFVDDAGNAAQGGFFNPNGTPFAH
jgi:hypothetical protein